jgi:hypothetical protein
VSWGGDLRRAENHADVSENSTFEANGAEAGVAPAAAPVAEAADGAFKVFLRFSNGERVEAGDFGVEVEAHRYAEQLMAAAAAATTASKWPRIGDRYFRPETIISIDVEASDVPRWTGSTGRGNAWTPGR